MEKIQTSTFGLWRIFFPLIQLFMPINKSYSECSGSSFIILCFVLCQIWWSIYSDKNNKCRPWWPKRYHLSLLQRHEYHIIPNWCRFLFTRLLNSDILFIEHRECVLEVCMWNFSVVFMNSKFSFYNRRLACVL